MQLTSYEHFVEDMAPFYEEVSNDLGWPVDQRLLDTMKAANEAKVKELEDSIADAEKNQGDMEVRDFMLKKAEYYSSIGAKVCSICYQILKLVSCKNF